MIQEIFNKLEAGIFYMMRRLITQKIERLNFFPTGSVFPGKKCADKKNKDFLGKEKRRETPGIYGRKIYVMILNDKQK